MGTFVNYEFTRPACGVYMHDDAYLYGNNRYFKYTLLHHLPCEQSGTLIEFSFSLTFILFFLFLLSYGGFSIPIQPSFNPLQLVFLQHFNGVLAIANIRGGAEYGEDWHKAGILEK